MTPERAVARAPSPVPVRVQSPRAPRIRAASPTPVSPQNYSDKSPAFNALYNQMAREPSPKRPVNAKHQNQFGRCPSPSFQMLQDELAWRQANGMNGPVKPSGPQKLPQFINGREEALQRRVVSPKPVRGRSPGMAQANAPPRLIRAVSPGMVPSCPSPTFQRIQRDFSPGPHPKPVMPMPQSKPAPQAPRPAGSTGRNQVGLKVISGAEARSRSRSNSPVITLTHHGCPPWAFAPRRRERSKSPAPRLAAPPAPQPQERSQSPTFNELQRQMAEKQAYPLNTPQTTQRTRSPANLAAPPSGPQARRSQSPTFNELERSIEMIDRHKARRARSRSPEEGLVALAPAAAAPAAAPVRSKSPTFNELHRQMVEKNAYPLNGDPTGVRAPRARSPTVRAMQRDLAASPPVTLAQHRSSSPSVRSRPQERRIVRLSSPVPFRKDGSPYRHVAAPLVPGNGYQAAQAPPWHMVGHVGVLVKPVSFLEAVSWCTDNFPILSSFQFGQFLKRSLPGCSPVSSSS